MIQSMIGILVLCFNLTLTMCACGYLCWWSVPGNVVGTICIWKGLVREHGHHPARKVIPSLGIILSAFLLLQNGRDILWTGHDALFGGYSHGRASEKMTSHRLDQIRLAVELFLNDCGDYPTEQQGLEALFVNPGLEQWKGPYLIGQSIRVDAWGRPYAYEIIKGTPVVYSLGPDGISQTRDDLCSQEPEEDLTDVSRIFISPLNAFPVSSQSDRNAIK